MKGDDSIKKHEKFWIYLGFIIWFIICGGLLCLLIWYIPAPLKITSYLYSIGLAIYLQCMLLFGYNDFRNSLKKYKQEQHKRWLKAPRYTIQVNTKDNFGYLVWSGSTFSLSFIDPDSEGSCTFTKEQINKLKHNPHLAINWNNAKIERYN